MDVQAELFATRAVRPIHYLGSKLRIIDQIVALVNELSSANGTVCDLFAGSGTVAGALSGEHPVTAVDIQEYSRVLCRSVLGLSRLDENHVEVVLGIATAATSTDLWRAVEPLIEYETESLEEAANDPQQICELIENGSLLAVIQGVAPPQSSRLASAMVRTSELLGKGGLSTSQASVVTRHFGGLYFSFAQAVQLDVALSAVRSHLPPSASDAALAAVLGSCSQLVNTIGKQFAQPIRPRSSDGRPKAHLTDRIRKDRKQSVIPALTEWLRLYQSQPQSVRGHRVLRSDYRSFLQDSTEEFDLVYADPPYTRDHYSRYYHVLETIARGDDPEISTTFVSGRGSLSRGMYRKDRHQSPFCIKSQAPLAFEHLFDEVRRRGIPLILSYSPFSDGTSARPRLMAVDQVTELAARYFGTVRVRSAGRLVHNKIGQSRSSDHSHAAEVFVICQP